MNITGIIAEYNPLHNGHVYHIKSTKEITNCDATICVMSGNFVQRGTPALLDKWTRAKMALENGIDLVIELPLVYSIASAEFFSYGAVSLLNALGVVNNLSFGSEQGSLHEISKIAKILNSEPEEYKHVLKTCLNSGLSYPKSRNIALCSIFDNEINIKELLNLSNNILAIEYCKSLYKLKSDITPITVQRVGGSYNSVNMDHVYASATSIRKYLNENHDIKFLQEKVPQESFDSIKANYENNSLVFEEDLYTYCKYKALSSDKNTLSSLPDASEGLHNKLYKAFYNSKDIEEFINNTKSKRYTRTRINRLLCQYFVGLDKAGNIELKNVETPYARVLGFNTRGIEILRIIKETSKIPIYTKLPKDMHPFLKLDVIGTNVYSLLNKSISPNSDYTISPIRSLNK